MHKVSLWLPRSHGRALVCGRNEEAKKLPSRSTRSAFNAPLAYLARSCSRPSRGFPPIAGDLDLSDSDGHSTSNCSSRCCPPSPFRFPAFPPRLVDHPGRAIHEKLAAGPGTVLSSITGLRKPNLMHGHLLPRQICAETQVGWIQML
jgi:hypothetical protein